MAKAPDVRDVERFAAVKRKLNITWEDDATDERVRDVIDTVTPILNLRCSLEHGHEFNAGQPEWSLFLNACLYEYSDALDDFWRNYASEVGEAHLRNLVGSVAEDGDA